MAIFVLSLFKEENWILSLLQLWMLYAGIIVEELMWFSSYNNKYSLDKAIIP